MIVYMEQKGKSACTAWTPNNVPVILPSLTYRTDMMWDDVTKLIQPALKKH